MAQTEYVANSIGDKYDPASRRLTKQQVLQHEFEELKRVGSVPFNSYLDPKLVCFDLSVLERKRPIV